MKKTKHKHSGNWRGQRRRTIRSNSFPQAMSFNSIKNRERTESLVSKESLIESPKLQSFGSWEWDIAADKIMWSPELYCIYGIDPKYQLSYDKLMERIHPDDREHQKKIVADWKKKRQGGAFEYRIVRPDGSIRFVHGESKIFCDETGTPSRISGIIHDITEYKLVEENLEKYKILFSKINDLAYICDEKGNILYLNKAFEKLSGHKVEEYIKKSFAPLFDAENLEIARENYSRTLKGESTQYELTFKDTGILCEYKNHPMRDKKNNIIGVLGIARDITKRMQAEKLICRKNQIQSVINEILNLTLESRNLEEILECALEKMVSIDWLKLKSQGAIFLVGENSDELVLKASRELSKELKNICFKIHIGKCLCGLAASRKEIMFANYLDDCHESRYLGMAPHAHYCVPIQSSGSILGVLNLYVENDHQRKKEEEDTLLAMANVLAGIIKRKQGEEELEKHRQHLEELVKERTVELTQINNQLKEEITERKRAEEEVRESEEKYRKLIKTSNDPIFLAEAETGMIIETNKKAEALLGRSQKEIIGMHYSQLHPPHEIGYCSKEFLSLIEKGGNVLLGTHAIHKDGHKIPVEISGSVISIKDKKIIQGIFRDISERRQAEEEIKARQKEIEEINANLENRIHDEVERSRQKDYIMIKQSRLAAMGEMIRFITHQWGQPLWALQLLFHNIEDSIESDGIKKEDTSGLIANGFALVKRMFTTMDDFKSFFQADRKKVIFSINKSIKDTLSLIGASFEYSNIPISLNEKEELMVLGFPNEFSQVILNILKNSKDAIVEKGIKGKIKIDFLRKGDFAIVRIKDNGGGIPDDLLDKIFDSYFTTKKEGKGTGIGLYLSKIIIEDRMNGSINAKNTKQGVQFEIILPMIQS